MKVKFNLLDLIVVKKHYTFSRVKIETENGSEICEIDINDLINGNYDNLRYESRTRYKHDHVKLSESINIHVDTIADLITKDVAIKILEKFIEPLKKEIERGKLMQRIIQTGCRVIEKVDANVDKSDLVELEDEIVSLIKENLEVKYSAAKRD